MCLGKTTVVGPDMSSPLGTATFLSLHWYPMTTSSLISIGQVVKDERTYSLEILCSSALVHHVTKLYAPFCVCVLLFRGFNKLNLILPIPDISEFSFKGLFDLDFDMIYCAKKKNIGRAFYNQTGMFSQFASTVHRKPI